MPLQPPFIPPKPLPFHEDTCGPFPRRQNHSSLSQLTSAQAAFIEVNFESHSREGSQRIVKLLEEPAVPSSDIIGLPNSLGTCSPNSDCLRDTCIRSLISPQRQEPIKYRLSKFASSRHRKLQPLRES
ncbi:unnamed protein product [Allacma fusca]|uniref:Uncharacterized protein n=1 Tax=Allacma fusca TaxID=39272 RepID=A0A8J2K4V9_9HEXA|nr:unnamed protein product [Allacma fusca]